MICVIIDYIKVESAEYREVSPPYLPFLSSCLGFFIDAFHEIIVKFVNEVLIETLLYQFTDTHFFKNIFFLLLISKRNSMPLAQLSNRILLYSLIPIFIPRSCQFKDRIIQNEQREI